jgi:hypothetical protein
MNRKYYLAFIIINSLIFNSIPGICQSITEYSDNKISVQDTINENQMLYNGRIWRNLFPLIKENQFLFSKEFLPASVTMRGKTFSDIRIKYDIFTDEIITPFAPAGMLQLNKLMVDSFSLIFQNKYYHFIRIPDGNPAFPGGYYNVVYKGNPTLYARYSKKIEKLADKDEVDKFYQINRIYLEQKGKVYNITGKKDLFRILDVRKKEVRQFMRENNTRISNEDPVSYISFLRFIDDLKD